MKQKKLLSLLLSCAIICGSFAAMPAKSAKAFGACSHYTLMDQTAKALPQDSIIKQALTLYPDVAAWGAHNSLYGPKSHCTAGYYPLYFISSNLN